MKLKKCEKIFFSILIRYLLILILAMPNLFIFYFIFTPLTLYPVYFLLNIFYEVVVSGDTIYVGDILSGISIEIIGACVAGSAYFLLFVLNISISGIKISKRIKMMAFAFIFFLVLNILRIFFLSILAISDSEFFDMAHKLFWYIISIPLIIIIWFLEVKIFKINKIPVYNDLKFLYDQSILK